MSIKTIFFTMDSTLALSLALLALSSFWALVYWRPRRKIWAAARLIPGPKPTPIIGNAALFWIDFRDTIAQFFKLRTEFGPVVRLWLGDQLMVMLSDPEDIKCLLGNPRIRNRHSTFSKAVAPFTGYGLFINEDEVWKARRQMTTPMFHFKVLESHVQIFAQKSAILMDKLDEVADGRTFDVYKKLSLFTLDSICETAFGQATNAQEDGFSELDEGLHEGMQLVYRRAFYPWLLNPWLYPLTSDGRKAKTIIKHIDAFSRGVISRKMAAYRLEVPRAAVVTGLGKTIPSFLDMLIEASETQGSILSEQDIKDEVTTIAFAGFDTTSIAMSALLVLIGMHPEWQDALYAEMSQVFADDMTRSATHQDLSKMPVLDRVIRETLRMYPSTAILARDIPEDVVLPSGYTLPAGSSGLVNSILVHRDDKNFPEPDKFLPDRWLPGSDRHPFSFLTFSAGPRNCIGQKYALLQMKTVVSQLIRRFKVTTDFTMEDMQKLTLSVSVRLGADGYRLQLAKRVRVE